MALIKVNSRGSNVRNLGRRNIFENGAMQIDQRGTRWSAVSGSTPGTGFMTNGVSAVHGWGCPQTDASTNYPRATDRIGFATSQNDGSISVEQAVDAPSGTGLVYSHKLTVTGTDTSLAAGQRQSITFGMEAHKMTPFFWHTSDAKSLYVQFWVKSAVTGTYSLTLRTNTAGMSYTAPYTISAANTWEKKTLTIPGPTSLLGGSVGSRNALFYYFIFALGMGSSFDTGADETWTAVSNGQGRSSHVNIMATSSATWQITGFQMEMHEHTDFEHRSFEEDLADCQRYFYDSRGQADTFGPSTVSYEGQALMWCDHAGSSTNRYAANWTFPVQMRARPTVYLSSAIDGASNNTSAYNGGSNGSVSQIYGVSANGVSGYFQGSNTGDFQRAYITATAEI